MAEEQGVNQASIPPPLESRPQYRAPVPLNGIPVPPAVAALAIVTLLALIVSLTRLPGAIRSGIDIQRAERAIASGDAAKAVPLLQGVLKVYPNAIDPKIDLADAYDKSGQPGEAIKALDMLTGVKVSRDQYDRAQLISDRAGDVKASVDEALTPPPGLGSNSSANETFGSPYIK